MLYPQDNECREVRDLSGIWRCASDPASEGLNAGWQARRLSRTGPVALPGGDAPPGGSLHGLTWYERTFFVPVPWLYRRVLVRGCQSAGHATVWVNGEKAGEHRAAGSPFHFEITKLIWFGRENRITIAIGGRTGEDLSAAPGFDAPILLLGLPQHHLESLRVTTEIAGNRGIVNYSAAATDPGSQASGFEVMLLDREGKTVLSGNHGEGTFVVPDAVFWSPADPYLYVLQVRLIDAAGKAVDCYRMRIGIRITKTLGKKFFLNGKPLYLKGCGMEPAVDRRAPACDPGTLVRSAAALGALNADSLRLGTAPGTEEMLELADEQGICAVVELPAAGGGTGPEQAPADNGTDHAELVARLRHHPSVVMWNLPAGPADPDGTSLRRAAAIVKKADPTRPVSVAVGLGSGEAKNAAFADVVCLDWSIGPEAGDPASRLAAELDAIWETCKKPVIFRWDGSSPDGSPAPGRQRWMLQQCGDALDARDYLAGEHLMTVPVRDPAAAHVLTERWKKK